MQRATLASLALAATVAAQAQCLNYVVTSKSSYDSTCDGSQGMHTWPVGVEASYCHGWSAADSAGNVQKFSATNLRCSSDSTMFLYTLHSGTVDCSSVGGNIKDLNFTLTCASNAPTDNLFQQGLDFSCCDQRSASFGNCNRGLPSVTWPTSQSLQKQSVYQNGELCGASTTKPTTTKPAATKAAVNTTTAAPTTEAPKSAAASASIAAATIVAALAML
ncbi:hypothetical protein ACHHYP_17102 [Achlya hypogyna]|uniref:Secreted protein n=1 Tax=Achlya hypogyna TaxID=1202772 RepID=A0A0A7CPR6_ACHHY|nr:secreted protein [Achlya hypogyna]OQR80865.1 hypothetical protein ACHHYP_17102 [Achlya hypogyna]